MTEHEQLMRDLANSRLVRTDFRILKAMAPLVASPEWCAWRDQLRDIYNTPEGVTEIPPEPPFGKAEGEVKALRERIAELEDALADAEKPVAPEPAPVAEPAVDLPPIDPKDADTIIEGFTGELRTGRDVVEGTMRSMVAPDRKRLFSLLNGEFERLRNKEAFIGESIPRRADVEELIGILAKVGEA